MRKALLELVAYAILVAVLPLLGLAVVGTPIDRYLEFPPTTRYVEHAAFSPARFALGVLIVLVPLAPFLRQALRFRAEEDAAGGRTRRSFPRWGWAALVSLLLFWALAWTRFPWFARFQAHTFTPLWLSFVVVVNAMTWRRRGTCLMTGRTRFFLLLFPASAVFWWSFEYLNRFVQNWYYLDTGEYGPWEYFWLATLPFSTVLPAVLSAREWLGTLPRLDGPFRRFLPLKVRRPAAASWGLLIVSVAGLAGIGIWPDQLYSLLWVAPLLILLSFHGLAGDRHALSGVAEGDWRGAVGYALAALACGFFWEMWNFHSLAKWEYAVPYLYRFPIFEMPVLGYAGYLPFGIECALVGDLVGRAAGAGESE